MSRVWYLEYFDKFLKIIKRMYQKEFTNNEALKNFIENGGWKARKNGRDLSIEIGYSESKNRGGQILTIETPRTEWKEWIRPLTDLGTDAPYGSSLRISRTVRYHSAGATRQGRPSPGRPAGSFHRVRRRKIRSCCPEGKKQARSQSDCGPVLFSFIQNIFAEILNVAAAIIDMVSRPLNSFTSHWLNLPDFNKRMIVKSN